MISSLYATAARYRRGYYSRRPELRRVLHRPVISIGNLAVGGRAKTPLAALVAARLRDLGETPSILSRGYGRRDAPDGVVVVRDPRGIRADLDRSGDEPLMLARQLDDVAVLVSSSRYLAGRLAEHHFQCTVHVLDDGFQHFTLHRDADLVVIGREDLERPHTVPGGRLREPLDAAAAADAFVALDDVNEGQVRELAAARLDRAGKARPVWRGSRTQGAATTGEPDAQIPPSAGPAIAIAGIAHPASFFDGLKGRGWTIARQRGFRDHHRYSRGDVAAIFDEARASGARLVLTTEKDFVRLLPFRPFPVPVAYVPLTLSIEPGAAFDDWLRRTVDEARR